MPKNALRCSWHGLVVLQIDRQALTEKHGESGARVEEGISPNDDIQSGAMYTATGGYLAMEVLICDVAPIN